MLLGAELEEERKMPLKLKRRGDLGGESWWDKGYGNTVFEELGLVLGRTGADIGLEGCIPGALVKKPFVGLAE